MRRGRRNTKARESTWCWERIATSCKMENPWSETTLNYWMMVERYPNPKEEVGSSIPSYETYSQLDKKTCQVVNCLLCFGDGLLSSYNRTKEKKKLKITCKLAVRVVLTGDVIARPHFLVPSHQRAVSTIKGCNQWLSLAELLKLALAGGNCSLVARTSLCGVGGLLVDNA